MSPPKPYDTQGCTFRPNFAVECHVCGETPTVVVIDHIVPQTLLCGRHFFDDRSMQDWSLWNDNQEATE